MPKDKSVEEIARHLVNTRYLPDDLFFKSILDALDRIREETIEEAAKVAESLCFCKDINHIRINAPMFCPIAKSIGHEIRQKGNNAKG